MVLFFSSTEGYKMLKRDITYEDFDGEKVTETFYFNLTRTELIELESRYENGLQGFLQQIIKTQDRKALVALIKEFVLLTYGKKSDDGKRFIKNDELREEFSQSAAYDSLFMEMATNDGSAATFINGVIPKGFAQEMEKLVEKQIAMPTVPKE